MSTLSSELSPLKPPTLPDPIADLAHRRPLIALDSWPVSEEGPGGTISYTYSSSGQLASEIPPGQPVITYTYNVGGQLT